MKKKFLIITAVAAIGLTGCDYVKSYFTPEKTVVVKEATLPTKEEVKVAEAQKTETMVKAEEPKTETPKIEKTETPTKVEVPKVATIETPKAENTVADLPEQVKVDYKLFNEAKAKQQAIIEGFQQEIEQAMNRELSREELNQLLSKLNTQTTAAIEGIKNLDLQSEAVMALKNETVKLFESTKSILEATISLGAMETDDNDKIMQLAQGIEAKSRELINSTNKVEQLEQQIIQKYNLQ